MTALDVIKDVDSGLGASAVMPAVYTFPFQQAEEAFCGGVVGTTAHGTHAANQVMPFRKR
jgi:hypothetical protein